MNDTTSSVVWTVAGVLLAIQVANCYVNVCAKLGVSVMVPLRRAASALLRPLRALRGLCDRIRRAFHGHGCPCCKVVVGKDFVIAPKWCRVEREDDCGKEARG